MTACRSRFERRARQEERLEKSLDSLVEVVSDMAGERDLDVITDKLEEAERFVSKAKRQIERLEGDAG